MPTGIIESYKAERGFGFIACPDHRDNLFFHINDCGGWTPQAGDACEFEIGEGRDGRAAAKRVHPVQVVVPPIPYHFADIDTNLAVADTPVWHDGQGSRERHTGKLRITLRALTPLLVGSTRYSLADATQDIKDCTVADVSLGGIEKKKDKSILEPLRLPDTRVALPGKSLNGMLRHSLGALLSAPMERVGEREYTYRPNLGFAQGNARLEVRPAVVEKITGSGKEAKIEVTVLPDARAAIFLRDDAPKAIKELGKSFGEHIREDVPGIGFRIADGDPDYQRIVSTGAKTTFPVNHFLFSYIGGLDGTGKLAKRHAERMNQPEALIHEEALAKEVNYREPKPQPVPDIVYQHYLSTQETLIRNMRGHTLPQSKEEATDMAKDIERATRLSEKQLIYVEVDQDSGEIRSLGHNFHYRWRYVDSVRQHGGEVRAILRPLEEETHFAGNGEEPEKLSGARLFCGYVSRREKPDAAWRQEGSDNIGRGRHQRLKGRIGCGFAVEHWPDGQPADVRRFLPGTDNGQFLIPLKTLGQPRPSAVEHYLRQPSAAAIREKRHGDGARLLTYGDLPELPGKTTDEPGELAGRKFYRHQPDAAHPAHREACFIDRENVADGQATLARFVSQPGTAFRFTLDFQDLRDWELGALLVTAFPAVYLSDLVAKLAANPAHGAAFAGLRDKLAHLEKIAAPALAHKLGYGRPLGLGSVRLCLDQVDMLGEKDGLPDLVRIERANFTADSYLVALASKLLESNRPADLARHLERWAAVHRYAGLNRAAYPRKGGKIFNHHTDIRRNHAKLRRQPAGSGNPSPEPGALPDPELPKP